MVSKTASCSDVHSFFCAEGQFMRGIRNTGGTKACFSDIYCCDLELIADLEKKCQGGEDMLYKFACLNLATEKKREYHKTYYDLEGVLKTNGDEYLKLIGVEINTDDKKRTLLGWEVINLEKNVKSGEDIFFHCPFLLIEVMRK